MDFPFRRRMVVLGVILTALLPVAAQEVALTYAVGIADGARNSDGVTFRVELLTEDGNMVVLARDRWQENAWLEKRVDLTPYAGQAARLRFVTEPGETTTDDWACWGAPIILLDGTPILDLTTARPWRTGILPPEGGEPVAMASHETGAQFRVGKRSCGKEGREGIFAHPPWKGALRGGGAFAEFKVTVGEPPAPAPVRSPLPASGADSSPFPTGLAPCLRIEGPLTLDGVLNDWPETVLCAPLVIREKAQMSLERVSHKPGWKAGWSGPADVSSTVCLAWDATHLYVAEIRRDDRLMTMDTMSEDFAGSDSLRLCFAAKGSQEPVVFAMIPEGELARPMVRCIRYERRAKRGLAVQNVRVAPRLYSNGWIQEIAIPLDALGGTPAIGEQLRFQLVVTDSDTPMERHYEMLWRPKAADDYWMNPDAYGTLVFCDQAFGWVRTGRNVFAVGERPSLECGLYPGEGVSGAAQIDITGPDGRSVSVCRDRALATGLCIACAPLEKAGPHTLAYRLNVSGDVLAGALPIEAVSDRMPEALTPLLQPAGPTLLPSVSTGGFRTAAREENGRFVFSYADDEETLTYTVTPALGFDVEVAVNGASLFRTDPRATGPLPIAQGKGMSPEDAPAEVAGVQLEDNHLTYRCTVPGNPVITYDIELTGKTLTLELSSPDAAAREVRGLLSGLDLDPVFVPYLHPVLAVYRMGGVFLSSYADWTVTGSSRLQRLGSTMYSAKTDGSRNPLRERLFLTASPEFAEVLANLPNRRSRFMDILAGKVVMDCWSWGSRFSDTRRYLERLKGYGVDELAIIFHVWQKHGYDNGLPEHLPANEGRGGDAEMRLLGTTAKRLGYLFSLHENYIDYYPNFPDYTEDAVALDSGGRRINAWYMPSTGIQSVRLKPSWIETYAGDQSPKIHRRYRTTAAYLDVHSVSLPFQIDFDAEAPGAASLRYSFERISDLFDFMRTTHDGPLFGEGNYHAVWAGRIDGCEAQIGGRGGEIKPVLPDYDLLKIHPLAVNHGMGYHSRWHRRKHGRLTDAEMRKYRARELAYGHAGFFGTGTMSSLSQVLQEYYLVQPLQARYAGSQIRSIRYLFDPCADGLGTWVTAQVACRTDAPRKVHTSYENGLNLWINDRRDNWEVIERILPPHGFAAHGAGVTAYTARLNNGYIGDYAETAETIFVNARTYKIPYVDDEQSAGITPLAPLLTPVSDRRFRITYRWDVRSLPDRDQTVFVHYTDSDGRILWQNDHRPVPAVTQWPLGAVFADGPHEVEIPSVIPSGTYQVRVGMFIPKVGRLTLDGVGDGSQSYRVAWLAVDEPGRAPAIRLCSAPSREGDAESGLNPEGTMVDFGTVVTDLMLRIDRGRRHMVVMPMPHGKKGTVLLRMDRLMPGNSLVSPKAVAVGPSGDTIGEVTLRLTGTTLTLETTESDAWTYRITLE